VHHGDEGLEGTLLGPLPSEPFTRGAAVTLELQPGGEMKLDVHDLELGRRYRLDWRLAPFAGAAPLVEESLVLPAGPTANGRRREVEVHVLPGWHLGVSVCGATVGNSPALDFTRGAARERSFTSLSYAWSEWEPVSPLSSLTVPPLGGRLHLYVSQTVTLAGVVTGIPYTVDADTLQVAALGEHGTWLARVDGNGWFELDHLPRGATRLVLYRRPAEPAATQVEQGEVVAELSLTASWSRFDVVLEWGE
jgi:hypothetical protein